MDKNLPKWIFASVAKHFRSLPNLHISTQYRDTNKTDQWYELKVDGPYFSKFSSSLVSIKIEIDLQILSKQKDNLYNNLELQGDALALFTDSISIFKLGSGADDTGEYLFCITLDTKDRHGLEVFNFGPVDGDDLLIMSDIEGHYHARIRRS